MDTTIDVLAELFGEETAEETATREAFNTSIRAGDHAGAIAALNGGDRATAEAEIAETDRLRANGWK